MTEQPIASRAAANDTGTVRVLADASRAQAAHNVHARAVDRVRALEAELDATFADLETARERMREEGCEVAVMLSRPADAAWAAWRNERHASTDEATL